MLLSSAVALIGSYYRIADALVERVFTANVAGKTDISTLHHPPP